MKLQHVNKAKAKAWNMISIPKYIVKKIISFLPTDTDQALLNPSTPDSIIS